ncbi:Uncharacterised protein [Chlamydia trachomatis]|nr:Uncharacterised protein [Chlamydia trachomatis]
MHVDIVADILKMLHHALGDVNFACCDIQLVHQRGSVVVGAVSGTKPRHCYADDIFSLSAQLIKCLDTGQECHSGIQTAAHANNYGLTASVSKPLLQSHHLDVHNLVACLFHVL